MRMGKAEEIICFLRLGGNQVYVQLLASGMQESIQPTGYHFSGFAPTETSSLNFHEENVKSKTLIFSAGIPGASRTSLKPHL